MQELPMHPFCMPGGAVTPAGDRCLTVTEDAHRRAEGESFSQGTEYLANPGRRRLEVGECGAPAGADLRPAGLAPELLDAVGAALVAVGDQGVDLRVGDSVVRAAGPPAGMALGGDPARCPTPTPPLGLGTDGGGWPALEWCGGEAAVGTIIRRAGVQTPDALWEPWQATTPRVPVAPPDQHQDDGQQNQRQDPGPGM